MLTGVAVDNSQENEELTDNCTLYRPQLSSDRVCKDMFLVSASYIFLKLCFGERKLINVTKNAPLEALCISFLLQS